MSRLGQLSSELRELEAKLREGGGKSKTDRQHAQGKLTARERIALLSDPGSRFLEVGLLLAYDKYDGQAPAAGVVTGLVMVNGRECVVVANDATVKAGSWWPETIQKILRAQEIAMRCRIPIVYLVDSAGVNLPYQGGVFPGQYGASRIFYYNSIMRRYLRIPQFAAVMGPCIAGGAYLPALSDVILMVEGTSFMGLGGPNLVKGATGQVIDSESLGGASTHTEKSGVAHYKVADDQACIAKLRELIDRLPATPSPFETAQTKHAESGVHPSAESLQELLPADHRMSYDMHTLLRAIVDDGRLDEMQQGLAREMICGDASIDGHSGRHHREPARAGEGARGRAPALRRNHLRGERREGRVLHRSLRPAGDSAALRAGRVGLHGRPRGRSTRGSSARARASSRRWPPRSSRRSRSP